MPNINTDIHSYTPIRRLHDYVSKALPTVFDDSLSYYEELSKILRLLNEVIDRVEEIEEDVQTLKEALEIINDFVDGLSDRLDGVDDEITAIKTRVTTLENTISTIAAQAAQAAADATAARTAATQAAASAAAASAAVDDIKEAFGIEDGDSGLIGGNDTPGIDGVDGNLLIDSDRHDFNTDIYNVYESVKDVSALPFAYGFSKILFNNAWVNLKAVALLNYTATEFQDCTWEFAQASGQPYYEISKTASATKKSIVIPTDLIDGSYIFIASDILTPTLAGEVTVAQYYQVTDSTNPDVKIVSSDRAYNDDFAVVENYNNFNNFYVNGRNLAVLKINKQSKNKPSWLVITHNNDFNLKVYTSNQTTLINDVKTNLFVPKNTKYIGYLVEDTSSALGFSILSYVNDVGAIIPRNLIGYEIFNALAENSEAITLTINDVSSIVDMINGEVI